MWPGTGLNRRHEDCQFRDGGEPCVTIGHQLNEFERLFALRSSPFFRSKHIVRNGSGKVVAKQ